MSFFVLQCKRECGVEQLVARQAHNLEVGGSSPSPATIFYILGYCYIKLYNNFLFYH